MNLYLYTPYILKVIGKHYDIVKKGKGKEKGFFHMLKLFIYFNEYVDFNILDQIIFSLPKFFFLFSNYT